MTVYPDNLDLPREVILAWICIELARLELESGAAS